MQPRKQTKLLPRLLFIDCAKIYLQFENGLINFVI